MDFFDLTIRPARPDDAAAIERLAQLDSARRPSGYLLVAEVAFEPIAAISLTTGEVVADPFKHTAEPVRLLRLRYEQLAQRREAQRPTPVPRLALAADQAPRVRAR
jgi:hypothetical protein